MPKDDIEKKNNIKRLVSEIGELTVLEIKELNDCLCKEFNITAGNIAMPGAGTAQQSNNNDVNKKVSVIVKKYAGTEKINMIKFCMGKITGKSLLDLTTLVNNPPFVVKENIPMSEAEELKKGLLGIAGTEVEIR